MARTGSFTLMALAVIAAAFTSANVIDDAVDAVGDAYDTTASWVDGAADTVGDTAEDVYNTTSSWVGDAADTVASATGSIIDDVSSAQSLAMGSATFFAVMVLAANTL